MPRPLPAAQPGAESSFMSIGFMVVIFVVFYFLLIRPQVKRQKEHKSMVEALKKGDEVLTAGGIVGKITEMSDQYITVQVAPSTAARPVVDAAAAVRRCSQRAPSSRLRSPTIVTVPSSLEQFRAPGVPARTHLIGAGARAPQRCDTAPGP